MVTAILSILAALLTALPQILKMIEAKVGDANVKAKQLAAIEAEESDASMARVDAEYDRLRQQPK